MASMSALVSLAQYGSSDLEITDSEVEEILESTYVLVLRLLKNVVKKSVSFYQSSRLRPSKKVSAIAIAKKSEKSIHREAALDKSKRETEQLRMRTCQSQKH